MILPVLRGRKDRVGLATELTKRTMAVVSKRFAVAPTYGNVVSSLLQTYAADEVVAEV